MIEPKVEVTWVKTWLEAIFQVSVSISKTVSIAISQF